MQFNPQQPPGPYPFLDEIEGKAHPATGYVLAGVGGVGGFFYGLAHPSWPLVLPVIVGIVGGLLAVALLKHLTAFLITAALVAAATLGAWWLFNNEPALRQPRNAPATQTAPASSRTVRGFIDDVRQAVRP